MTSVVVDDLDGSQPMCPLWAAMNQVWRGLWQDKMIKKVNLITHKACQHSNNYLGLQCVACRHNVVPFLTNIHKRYPIARPLGADPGGRLNKKDGLTRYGDSHVKDKTS